MFSSDRRPQRRIVRPRPRLRPGRVAVEGLESRQLLTYSPFGFSLPALSVTGFAAPTAAYGGPLTIDVDVENQGASSLVEPTHLAPGSVSNADSAPTTVEVFASPKPNATSGLLQVDTINIPAVRQNSDYNTISAIALPDRPKGFPGVGGKLYLTLVVNNNQAVLESSTANNIYRVPTPVTITDPLPDLQVVALDIPSPLQPGEVIAPTIRIENFGSADPAAQGPVTVELVASQNQTFGPGDAVVASYVIRSLPGISGVPTQATLVDDENVIPPPNVNTTTLAPLKLPTTPGFYYLGIVIDPLHTINQTYAPNPKLRDVQPVGPAEPFLPAGRLILTPTGSAPVFPALPSTVINPISPTTTVTVVPIFPNPNPAAPPGQTIVRHSARPTAHKASR